MQEELLSFNTANMKEVINLEEILNPFVEMDCLDSSAKNAVLEAMKEACSKTLELAAENARAEIKTEWEGNTGSESYDNYAVVNKQSILDTIKQIE